MIRPLIRLIIIALLVWPAILLSAEQRARLDLLVNQRWTGVIDVVFRGDDVMTRVTDLAARCTLPSSSVGTIACARSVTSTLTEHLCQ